MKVLEWFYAVRNKPVPYYARYSLLRIISVPIRKTFNVVIIPNTPFNGLRIFLYRLVGFKIGKRVFIGMKCYLDDLEPDKTRIEDNVIISYGVYFSLHGRGQGRSFIHIQEHAYIGMRATLVAKSDGLTIGKGSIVGASSLVLKDIPENRTAVGVPAKLI